MLFLVKHIKTNTFTTTEQHYMFDMFLRFYKSIFNIIKQNPTYLFRIIQNINFTAFHKSIKAVVHLVNRKIYVAFCFDFALW